MNPAFSVIIFTTLAGAAQGMVLCLATAVLLGGLSRDAAVLAPSLVVALVMLLAGLVASFFHLGHPERAWRAAMMWRTSWLSREVIALPAFMVVVALWWLSIRHGGGGSNLIPLLAIVLALALWLCTGMIYACIRFIQEWAHSITVLNFVLMGLSSGLILTTGMALACGQSDFARTLLPWALAATVMAWVMRMVALQRNAGLKPISSLQSATGIQTQKLEQKSMGMSAGAFNTREFFHRATQAGVKRVKLGFVVLAFAVPTFSLVWALTWGDIHLIWVALPVQYLGLLAERWFFFAQARHPQNLYYQVVS
ncbi:MAG: dimethyl sulfoxide reductase anchor subunit [Betaproteobacteria bacterium]|jgi:DMSO reductase anchor subunit|nr:dimethyl sulfoxide reductase anchor subunit [Betaproteobacteria bacterium]MBP6644934.1 dimethyl sulfoxide reductase anchor subunit [Burkholderiaceae bacterium]